LFHAGNSDDSAAFIVKVVGVHDRKSIFVIFSGKEMCLAVETKMSISDVSEPKCVSVLCDET